MDDKSWNDYLTGLNTGVALSPMGQLGVSHRVPPPLPPAPVIPSSPRAATGGMAPSPVLPGQPVRPAPVRPTPVRPRRPPTWVDRWVWHLAETLTTRFDERAQPIMEGRHWRRAIAACAILSGLAVLVAFPPGAVSSSAVPWTVAWFIQGALVFGVGALLGAAIPILMVLLIRAVIWIVGTAVAILGALAMGGAVIGGIGLIVYIVVMIYQNNAGAG